MSGFTRKGDITFAVELSRLIKEWIECKKGRNLGLLAKKLSGKLCHSTVYAAFKLESIPTVETVEKILTVITSRKKYNEYMNRFFPELVVRRGVISTNEEQNSDADVMDLLPCQVLSKVLFLATDGTDETEILDKCGTPGLRSIRKLVADGLAESSEGVFKAPDFKVEGKVNLLKVLQAVLTCIESNKNIENDIISGQWTLSKVTAEEARQIADIFIEAGKKAAKIRKNSSGGNVRLTFGSFTGKL